MAKKKKRIPILGKEARALIRRAKAVKYRDNMPARAERLCRVHGFTRADLAVAFGTHPTTINFWMRKHPEFEQAVLRGKDAFDCEVAEHSLIRRVTGYNLVEVTEERQINKRYDFFTGEEILDVEMVPVKRVHKHLPPDVSAIKMWLGIRNPARWPAEKQSVDVTLTKTMTDEQLDERIKQLSTEVGIAGAVGRETKESEETQDF